MEIWKDIIGYEGMYKISNIGNVLSVGRVVVRPTKGKIYTDSFILKPQVSGLPGNDYLKVCLHKDGSGLQIRIHRLVGIHFIENPSNFKVLNHIDRNRYNNRWDNLEWVSTRENVSYSIVENKKSNHVGVYWHKRDQKWSAAFYLNRRLHHLGVFKDEESARIAYLAFMESNSIQNKYVQSKA